MITHPMITGVFTSGTSYCSPLDNKVRELKESADLYAIYDQCNRDGGAFIQEIHARSTFKRDSVVKYRTTPLTTMLFLFTLGIAAPRENLREAAKLTENCGSLRFGVTDRITAMHSLAHNLDRRPVNCEFTVRELLERNIDEFATDYVRLCLLELMISIPTKEDTPHEW